MQSQEEDDFFGRRNVAHQKNKIQKNSTKETTNKRPQLPEKVTYQRQDNTNRQGYGNRHGNETKTTENKDSQPVNGQRSNGKPLANVGRGGVAVTKNLPLAAESKTMKQPQKVIPENQNQSKDSKTITEYAEYHHGNG